jgi:prepilin-type processing-associated H-X9-DG protein
MGVANANGLFNTARLPYRRCPSDGFDASQPHVNYVASVGSQCTAGNCGDASFNQNFQTYCNQPSWGIPASPDHGNDWNATGIRGLFNRLGAKITFPAGIPDGTSNTIMLGEQMIGVNDHNGGSWWHFNGGASHSTTITPINYRFPEQMNGSNCSFRRDNWNISWGFGSRHTGGANFAFADGSIQFLNQAIDHRTYQLLGCRNDGQPVALP